MVDLVQVVVDVPTMQTNQPYTYSVPDRLTTIAQAGMRVIVPFGAGHREVQGFIVGKTSQSKYEGDLKPISAVMDLTPVVNPELLQLSHWMADTTYAFWITCLYTMLPNLLKAKSQRMIRIIDELSETDQIALFGDQDELDFAKVQHDPEIVQKLSRLQREKKIEFVYQVNDRAQVKTVTAIKANLTFEQYEDELVGITKNAKAQRQLILYLQLLDDQVVTMKRAQEITGLSASTFNLGQSRGWLTKVQQEVYRDPFSQVTVPENQNLTLNQEQTVAVNAINQAVETATAQTFLLQGVTGSGKTEVYLRVMQTALDQGKTALMLVPEISLTPQIVGRVRSRFGDQVAVLHSGLSNGELYDEWRRITRGEAKVVVGTRSAIFAPLDNLGTIIMDEEHEGSYKQDESPRYHAREVAKWRSEFHQAPLVLGSATPSLESRSRAEAGLYQRLVLSQRANQQALPPIEIVDMRPEVQKNGETNFSQQLLSALHARLERHEQSVLLLNRRGFSSFVMCRDCGYVLKCPNCDISLTLHMDSHSMKCHYCGHEEPIPNVCPQCQSRRIRYYGTGTEKVAAELGELLPGARIIRMDVDTTRRKGMHQKLLDQFGNHEADILLGTQMIAKGLDYPNVTLVGVLNADTGLDLPDFRSAERSFDLLTQVSGRAGRANKAGQVFIQTFNPDNYVIQLVKDHDYERFFATEMNLRKLAAYPPYYYTVRVMGSHPDEKVVAKAMFEIRRQLDQVTNPGTIFLGPTPRAIARLKNRYYYQIIIKYRQAQVFHPLLSQIMHEAQSKYHRDLQISIDPDPQYFM